MIIEIPLEWLILLLGFSATVGMGIQLVWLHKKGFLK